MARWARILGPLLIVLSAVLYYGSYVGFWFNPHDEGGTAALISSRLLAGEVAFKQVELGYNIGWFWPIVALFKAAGVNFVLMRGYFFALSTLCALWGWAVTRKVSRNEWVALAVGIALVIFPGSQFKNYIPMFCVANMLALVTAALGSGSTAPAFWRRVLLGGIVLGLTFLVRIDLGYLATIMWIGLIAFRLFDRRTGSTAGRFVDALAAYAILAAALFVTNGPAVYVAKRGGYGDEFLQQYRNWATFISGKAESIVAQRGANAGTESGAAAVLPVKPTGGGKAVDRSTLARVDWATFKSFKNSDKSVLFILTYLPPIIFAVLIGWAAAGVLGALFSGKFTLDHPAMIGLLLLGGSLLTFPQFFSFRPDRPHLSEFMPGFIVATVSVFTLLKGRWRWVVGGLMALQFGFFAWYASDHYSAGTIAARTTIKKNKRALFEGANGVRVWVHMRERDELETIRKAVAEHSKPGDWLVCWPYQPGYNVMTDRPTYERELYQDNATAPGGWGKGAIARIEDKKPAMIIIDDRQINQVESSKFSKWAARVHAHIRTNYDLCATVDTIEIYSRKTEAPAPTTTTAP